MSDDPRWGDRIIDELSRLTMSIDTLRAELVRKDVYEVNERARSAEVDMLKQTVAGTRSELVALENQIEQEKKDQEAQRRSDRRLLVTAFIAPVVLLLVQLYIASQFKGG